VNIPEEAPAMNNREEVSMSGVGMKSWDLKRIKGEPYQKRISPQLRILERLFQSKIKRFILTK